MKYSLQKNVFTLSPLSRTPSFFPLSLFLTLASTFMDPSKDFDPDLSVGNSISDLDLFTTKATFIEAHTDLTINGPNHSFCSFICLSNSLSYMHVSLVL